MVYAHWLKYLILQQRLKFVSLPKDFKGEKIKKKFDSCYKQHI